MALDPKSVGAKGKPARRSWTSKDSLLYAVGVGAGTKELQFTTENTKDTPQRVLPTMAVILGGGGVPFDKIGTFNPALMVHGTEDPMIPLALAEASRASLQSRGYSVEWHTWPMPHSICEPEVEAIARFLAQVLGGVRAPARSSILLPGR